MANNQTNNNEDNQADLIKDILATIIKMDKVDTAFGSRFDELMKFQTILKTFEKKISDLIKVNETKLEKATERLANSKQDITALNKEIIELRDKSQSHRDYITNGLNRTEVDVGKIKSEQSGLNSSFNTLTKNFDELKEKVNKKNKIGKVVIWSYRGAIAVMAAMFLYYYSTLNTQIDSLNKKIDTLSKQVLETKAPKQQTPDEKPPADNKSKPNKK